MNFTFATVVNEKYQRYIPLFCYCFFRLYPTCKVHLFLTEKLDPRIKHMLPFCYSGNDGGIIQIDYKYKDYPKVNQQLKSIRWILNIHDFVTDVYIGDIDILIMEKGIPENHTEHCMKNNLPYSNALRPQGSRLTGLQYCLYDYFYDIMNVQQGYAKLLRGGQIKFNGDYRNEHLLYDMIEKAGLGFPKDYYRPHHGLHLGLWRAGVDVKKVQEKQIMSDGYADHFKEFEKAYEEKTFQEMISALLEFTHVDEITNMIQWFKRFD